MPNLQSSSKRNEEVVESSGSGAQVLKEYEEVHAKKIVMQEIICKDSHRAYVSNGMVQ